MRFKAAFLNLDKTNRNIGAMIRNSFKIGKKIGQNKSCLYCALALAQSFYVVLFQLVAQIIDNFFQGFYGFCLFNVPRGKGGEGQSHDFAGGGNINAKLLFCLIGKFKLLAMKLFRCFKGI